MCGGREWADAHPIYCLLNGLGRDCTIVHGGARGADQLAGEVARSLGLTEEPHFADWQGKGRRAGHIRNREMLDSGVHEVWAFKDYFDWTFTRGGTENMVSISKLAGIPTYVVGRS